MAFAVFLIQQHTNVEYYKVKRKSGQVVYLFGGGGGGEATTAKRLRVCELLSRGFRSFKEECLHETLCCRKVAEAGSPLPHLKSRGGEGGGGEGLSTLDI